MDKTQIETKTTTENVDKTFNLLTDLDDLHFRSKCACSLISMVIDATESGSIEFEQLHRDALYGIHDYLDSLLTQQESTTEELFNQYFKSKKSNEIQT